MGRKTEGIRRKRQGWQAHTEIRGKFYSHQFPLATPVQEMLDWIADQKDRYGGSGPTAGSFAADIETYLARVSAMPSYKQRAAHLALWAHALGRDRPRSSITAGEIDAVMQAWLTTPTYQPGTTREKGRPSNPHGLEPGTVRKRRTALRSFFTTMDGKTSTRKNPVSGTMNPKEPKPEARALDYLAIERAIAAMPTQRDTKKGLPPRVSLSKLRARVMAYTGIPPGLLKTVTPTDLSLTAGTVRIVPRSKGRGVEARTLPLTPDGLDAFTDFHAAHAYGPFNTEKLNQAFKRGCQRAGLDPDAVTLYDLRHSFLTTVYRTTGDLATVARLGLHSEGSPITARYARGANAAVDSAAVAAFGEALAQRRRQAMKAAPVHDSSKILPAEPARAQKSKSRRRLRLAV